MTTTTAGPAGPWESRVASGDWDQITTELNEFGGALLPRLLSAEETAQLRGLYPDVSRFRSTVDMARHRFGRGEYRYFRTPCPEPVQRLKEALYPPVRAGERHTLGLVFHDAS